MCGVKGYCYNFDLYCGNTLKTPKEPLGTLMVKKMLQPVTDHNFFNSYDLLVELKTQGFKATGTIRNNRTASCPSLHL